MPTLAVIVCSTRPGRIGASIATWFSAVASAQSSFDIELVDLKEVALPLFDEPNHPMLADYVHDHTKRWSAIFPELPGCGSAGDTEEEAVANAKEALALWFEPTPVELHRGAKLLEVALA